MAERCSANRHVFTNDADAEMKDKWQSTKSQQNKRMVCSDFLPRVGDDLECLNLERFTTLPCLSSYCRPSLYIGFTHAEGSRGVVGLYTGWLKIKYPTCRQYAIYLLYVHCTLILQPHYRVKQLL